MAAILYLAACVFGGTLITREILDRGPAKGIGKNYIWTALAFSFGTGVLLTTWVLYFSAYLLHAGAGLSNPLLPANIIVFGILLAAAVFAVIRKRRQGGKIPGKWVADRRLFRKECILYGILLVFVLFTMTYVFHQSGDRLWSGYTVFGDYAPHTAMIRSFSRMANYPTQYPHFGNADVKYHFMFQFLVGNLEYLGMRIDIAYNLVSALSLWFFWIMLCQLAYRISGRFLSMVFVPLLFTFRSGTAFFRFAFEHAKAGDLLETLRTNTTFIGYTPNENWGLWNYNVYLNQRHLGFGLLIAAICIFVFWDSFEHGLMHEERGLAYLKGRLVSPEAWKMRLSEKALLLGMIFGLCSFWNGACVIGGLLILCGMAVFSDGKADYVILAVVSILFSWIEAHIFIFGSAVSPSFYWGFLSESKTVPGVLLFLVQITGVSVFGLIPAAFFMKRRERTASLVFLFPLFFAFLFSLTPDINVNHKYIMISLAFLTVIWGGILARLFCTKRKSGGRRFAAVIAGCVLLFLLTCTGIYDFVVIIKDNDKNHSVYVNTKSEITDWLSENLTEEDLILTPEYSMNEVTMSGVMMYMGWPYYAWSAGYDTYTRAEKAVLIYTTPDAQLLSQTVEEEKIGYILFEDGMRFEEKDCREDIIRETYPEVFVSADGRIRIYDTGIKDSGKSE